jgi:hypothetical protein
MQEKNIDLQIKYFMKIQSSVLVPLGFGRRDSAVKRRSFLRLRKYVRSDRVTALVPIEEERGSGRRTFVHLEGEEFPLVASRSESTIVRDIVQEPKEITQSRQQQEILRDLLSDLSQINGTVRRINRDEGGLDLDRLEQRIRQVIEDE